LLAAPLAAACGDAPPLASDPLYRGPSPTVTITGPTPFVPGGASVRGYAPWHLTRPPEYDTLEIEFAIGNSCDYFDRIEVAESADRVAIAVYTAEHGHSCDDYEWRSSATITLGAPLGERELYGCDPDRSVLGHSLGSGECAKKIED
jgi:hypothetical protein